MKQMRLFRLEDSVTSDGTITEHAVEFVLDFQRMLDLATEQGVRLDSMDFDHDQVRIFFYEPDKEFRSQHSYKTTGHHPTLHAAIRAEIERLSK